jgi:hypothetical protein
VSRPTGRSRARILAAACLTLALLTAACGGDDDDQPDVRAGNTTSTAAGATTTSAPSDASTSTTPPEAGPDTTAGSGGGPGTTQAPSGPPAATAPPGTPAPGPVALTPAPPGTYRYATSGGATFNGTPAPFPGVTFNVIDPPAGSRQHATRNLRDASGNGSVIEYTFDYRPDGVYLVSLRFTTSVSGFPPDVRDLTPPAPLLFLATGAGAGASQTLDIAVGTASARVVVDVLGEERVTVGGQGVDTLIVRSVATLPPGQVTGTQALTINLDRGTGLWVRERGIGDATGTVGPITVNVHTEYTATLQSLSPG